MTPPPPKSRPDPATEDRATEDRAGKPRGRGGRGTEEATVQVSLRLPVSWVRRLRQQALAATAREESIITPQEIMRRIISAALKAGD